MRVNRVKQLWISMMIVLLIFGTMPAGFVIKPVSADVEGFTVTYDGNGADSGDVPVDPTIYESGDLAIVHDNVHGLTKEGYIFAGWNTKADGKGTDYIPGQTFTMGTGNITLYAKWINPYKNWTARFYSSYVMNDIAFMEGVFSAVGNQGVILSFVEETIWTRQKSDTTKNLYGITSGNGKFVAVGADGTLLISANGVDWFHRVSGTTSTLRGVAYGDGLYVAVGDGGTIITSRNASYWTSVANVTTKHLNAVTYANGQFVAVGQYGTILTSTDGQAWTEQSSGVGVELLGVIEGGGKIVAVGASGTVLTSADGVTWEVRTSDTTNTLYDVIFAFSKFYAVGGNGTVMSSANGETWSLAASGSFNVQHGIAYGEDLLISVGYNEHAYSRDGLEWNKYSNPGFYGVNYLNGKFIAVGSGIYTSENGAIWTKRMSSSVVLRDIAYGEGLHVAVGNSGNIVTSSDGVEWTFLEEKPTTNTLNGVAYGKGTFVAVGDSGTVVYSDDGVEWSATDTGLTSLSVRDVVYGDGMFVAVGPAGSTTSIGKYYYSEDGETWENGNIQFVHPYSVTYAEGSYLAAGLGKNSTVRNLNMAYSTGKSFTPKYSSAANITYNGISYYDGYYAAVGTNGTIVVSGYGSSWTSIATNVTATFNGVAGGNGTFVAAGTSGIGYQTVKEAPANYTVHFDPNGGDGKADPPYMVLMPGDELGELPKPLSRSGYRFIGWNTSADGDGDAADESLVINEDTVLYAQWEELSPPSVPENLNGTDGVNEVILTWDAAMGAERYSVYQFEGAEAPTDSDDWELVASDLTETTYTITGLTNGTSYTFAVTAANEGGTSDYSAAVTAVPGGNGTVDHPYLIWDAERLDQVRGNPSASYVLVNDIDLSGYGNWTPIIGWDESTWSLIPFTGHFDGRGHTISGLSVNASSGDVGLFGRIGSGGTVRDLVLSDVDISIINNNAGALAGTLEGSAFNIRVSGGTVYAGNQAGGLVGKASNGAVIEGSCTNVRVIGKDYLTSTGGLVGSLSNAEVYESCSLGEASGGYYVGGLVGIIENSEIHNSYSTGSVRGPANVGGLVGGSNAASSLMKVYAAGKVECSEEFCFSGGLVGDKAKITVTSSYYDKGRTGQSDAEASSGTPLKPSEMSAETSFVEWDFDTIWHLDDRDGMPTLLWNDQLSPVISGAKVSNETPDQVSVYFPEKLVADEEALARFTVYVDSMEAQVDDAQLDDKELILKLAAPVANRQEVKVQYTDGDPAVTDKKGNKLAAGAVTADNEVEPNIKIVSVSPADDATGVAVNSQLILTFNDTVEAMPGKYIYLMTAGGNTVAKIEASSSDVQVEYEVVTITLPDKLFSLKEYYVLIDDGAFRHAENDIHGGISRPDVWNFVTALDSEAKWVSVDEDFAPGKVSYPRIKADKDGTLYVLFGDQTKSKKATVMKLEEDETEWSLVGEAGFSSGGIGIPSLLVEGDTLYAAYRVDSSVYVMKYELDAEEEGWTQAGSPLASDDEDYGDPHLLMHEGTLYVGYRDHTGKMSVKKLDASGEWVTVGDASFSPSTVQYPSLTVLDDTLYAGFQDDDGLVNYGTTVMKFNEADNNWELVGSRGFTGHVTETVLVSSATDLYVVYASANDLYKAAAMKLNFDDQEWVRLGSDAFISSSQAYGISATVEDGELYVAYSDGSRSNRLTVRKFAGGKWLTVASTGFTKGAAYESSLIVHDGIPYVVYEDAQSKLSAMKFGTFNLPPKAASVKIDGTLRAGQTVTGKYTYSDDEDDEEGDSTYQWYVADSANGSDRTAITDATSTTLTLTKDHIGKYLIFEVTPAASEGTSPGTAVSGSPAGPVLAPEPPAAPNVTADDVLNVIVGADEKMEYSTDNGASYTPYDPGNPPKFDGDVTVLVRVAADDETATPAGADTTLTFTENVSAIDPSEAEFDKYSESEQYKDIVVTVKLNGNMFESLWNGEDLLESGTDYTKVEDEDEATITILKSYLKDQEVGDLTLTFVFSAGANQTLTIEIKDTTPENSEINPTEAEFDKYSESEQHKDITVTLTLKGNTLASIKNGTESLERDVDYTVDDETVTIKTEYLKEQEVGDLTLTFVFSAGADQILTIEIKDTTPENSEISPTEAEFDKYSESEQHKDITVTLTLKGNMFESLWNGEDLLESGTDYTKVEDEDEATITILKSYLKDQEVGDLVLTFIFSAGADQTLTIEIKDTTPENSEISPTEAEFDKYSESEQYKDIVVTVKLNGNMFESLWNGEDLLESGTDYTKVEDEDEATITILKSYLKDQEVGDLVLTFIFTAGANRTLKITIKDTTPIEADAPVLQAAEPGNAQVTLTWSPVIGATGYMIFASETSGVYETETATVTGSVYSYTVTGLTNGTTYYFAVKSMKSDVESEFSNELSAVPYTVPGAPTNVAAVAGNGQVTVTFTAPSDNGGSEITGFEVTVTPGGKVVTGTSTTIVVTGLTNGVSYTFTVKAVNKAGSSDSSDPSNAVVPSAPPIEDDDDDTPTQPDPDPVEQEEPETEQPDNTVIVLVNGKEEKAGTVTTSTRNNQTVTTITIDPAKLDEKLAEEGQNSIVTIPVPSGSDIAVGELNGQMVKNMEEHEAVLEIRTDRAAYTIPAKQINIDAISAQVGDAVELQDIMVEVEIGELTEDKVQLVENAADGTFTLVAPPVEFIVRATYGETSIEVAKFDIYVERTIAIPDDVDPTKITTGAVIEPDGTVRHVPTKIVMIDGKYYAVINSLTNSIYTVIWNPKEFSDMADHWARDTVNNMGSRMIIEGTGNGRFSPDRKITRAEFAAIIVRALGLALEKGPSVFTDVSDSDWYSSAVRTAHAYGLLNGYTDGTFRPHEKITREQAMVAISRALELTGLKAKLPAQSADDRLAPYTDAAHASGWALSSIAEVVQAGIVNGRSDGTLAPQDHITRAEAAAMIERLLQKSDLI